MRIRRVRGALAIGLAWLALPIAAVGQTPAGNAPPAGPPGRGSAATPDVAAAPRDDYYSVYSDAFYNPKSIQPEQYADPTLVDQLFQAKSHARFFAGSEALWYNRTNSANRVLVTTSNDIFPFIPGPAGTPEQVNPGFFAPGGAASAATFYPINSSRNPNDPNLNRIYDENGVSRGNIPGLLTPGGIRMSTNDFDFGTQPGVRTRFGIQFAGGNSIEVNYFVLNQFKAAPLIDDVSGSAFLTRLIIPGANEPVYQFQRMGFLNSFFVTNDSRFQGEQRLPPINNPANEVPPVVSANNANVPREPTINDNIPLSGPQAGAAPLWRDGELAIATYSFNIQGGELAYRHGIFQYALPDAGLSMILGVRYVAFDDRLGFFFADTTLNRQARNPFVVVPNSDPTLSAFNTTSQTVAQVSAVYQNVLYNRLVGPEFGLSSRLPFWEYFELDLTGKGSWAANFMGRKSSIIRGDGQVLYDYYKDRAATSGIIEGRVGVNFVPIDNIRIMGGWECMWLIDVATASSTLNYNNESIRPTLNNTLNQYRKPSGIDSVLFFGWFAGVDVTF